MNPLVLKSRIEISQGVYKDIQTEIPFWILLILVTSSAFLIKEIYNQII